MSFSFLLGLTTGAEAVGTWGAYRRGDHQPVIPVDAAHNPHPHKQAQDKTYRADGQGKELDDDKRGPASHRVDVIRRRPRGDDIGGWLPHGC